MTLAAPAALEMETPPPGRVIAFRSPKIVAATLGDVPAILPLCRAFLDAADLFHGADFCPASMAATLERMIADEASILLIATMPGGRVVGMAAGVTYPAYFNSAIRIGTELFWYVEPEQRGIIGPALLRAMEERAREAGCKQWIMGALASQRPEAVARLYGRYGYSPAETTFIKAL